MNARAELTHNLAQVTSKKILVNIHYFICVIALWSSIIFSMYLYKGWYVITAITVALTMIFALIGAMRVDGLFKAIIPMILYFSFLSMTSFWAVDPLAPIYQVLVDLILLFNFGLFFLLGLNNSLSRIANVYILAAYPAIAAIYLYSVYPVPGRYVFSERIGWTGLIILPYALPFCIWKVKTSNYRSGLVSLLLTLLLILISRTRAPILIAAVLIPLTTIVLGKNFRSSLAYSFRIGVIILLFIAGASLFEKPRSLIFDSFERLRGKTVEWAYIGEQSEDWMRKLSYIEGLKLFGEYQPLGMGYMNFGPWFEKTFGLESSMHSAWLAWGLEGGIICLGIVFYLLYRFYYILYTMVKEADDEDEKGFYKAMMISMLGVLLNAVVNQAHQGPTLFVLLGIAYSLPHRHMLYSKFH